MESNSDHRSVIVDAAARFNVRAELAEFDTRTDELQLIRQTLRDQVPLFASYLKDLSPDLYNKLSLHISNGGMQIQTYKTIPQDSDEACNAKVSDADYGVYFTQRGNVYEPQLYITLAAIKEMHRVISPLYSRIESESAARRLQLEGASMMIAWMALGKWAYDALDGSPDKEGIIRRYRLMGMFGYIALMHQIDKSAGTEIGGPQTNELGLFKLMYALMVDAKAEKDPTTISAMEYSLADPMRQEEAKQVISSLTRQDYEL